MRGHIHITYRLAGIFALMFLFMFSSATGSQAACISGLPCVIDKTENDPWDDIISPNEPGAPNAHKTMGKTCDADFMNQIYAKAFMHAERENLMLETIIRKPDSVLEYSCFESIVNKTACDAPPLFSETVAFSENATESPCNSPNDKYEVGEFATIALDGELDDDYLPEPDNDIGNDNEVEELVIDVWMHQDLEDGETRLGNILEQLILEALIDIEADEDNPSLKYIDANFAHDFLGGSPSGLNNDFTGEIEPSNSYFCDMMNFTWRMAKCHNFATEDKFFSFEDLSGLDPRIYPDVCDPAETAITGEYIEVSKNEDFVHAHIDSSEFVDVAGELRYIDFMVGGDEVCLDPVPTGVTVFTYSDTTNLMGIVFTEEDDHQEHVCINPGCYYNPEAGRCVK